MQIVKRILVILLILLIILLAGGYFLVYFTVDDDHRPHMEYIIKYSDQYDLDPKLVTAVVETESNFNPEAKSGAGALGLMQIMLDTGEEIAKNFERDFSEEDLLDPETNIKFGTYYLRYLFNYFNSRDYAILAYNAGLGNVDLWIQEGILTGNPQDYENIPFKETKNYIKKVKERYQLNNKIFDVYYMDTESGKWGTAFKVYMRLLGDIFN